MPDYIFCISGHFGALEVKRCAKEKTEGTLQEYNINKIKDTGGSAYFVYPENFDKIKKELLALSARGNA